MCVGALDETPADEKNKATEKLEEKKKALLELDTG